MIFASHDIRPTIDWDSGGSVGAITETTDPPNLVLIDPVPSVDVTLSGTAGDDLLEGGDGDDLIRGFAGDDTLLGRKGNDTLIGGVGDDSLRAGDEDTINWYWTDPNEAVPYSHNYLDGGAGDDTLIGSPVIDTLLGGDGDDWIETGASDADVAQGGLGNDTIIGTGILYGEAGNDRLVATDRDATLKGGSGEDDLVATSGANLFGGSDSDRFLFADWGSAKIEDLEEIDRLVVEGRYIADADLRMFLPSGAHNAPTQIQVARADGYGWTSFEIAGGLGQALFTVSYVGADTILVAYERAELNGSYASEDIVGTDVAEVLRGGGGTDTMTGGGGNDLFVADLGRSTDVITDFVFDEDRIDLSAWGVSKMSDIQITYLNPQSALIRSAYGHTIQVDALTEQYNEGFVARDFLFAETPASEPQAQWVAATSEADAFFGAAEGLRIDGGEGWDSLTGSSADDSLFGGSGNDTLNGGDGDDLIWGDAGYDLLIGGAGADRVLGLLGRDTIFGGDGNDTLDGGADKDNLVGQAGDDRLLGRNGEDTLFGGEGSDALRGGAGSDVFFMRAATDQGQDVIEDFVLGVDVLAVEMLGLDAGTVQVSQSTTNGPLSIVTIDGFDTSMTVKNVLLTVDDLTLV